MLRQRRFPQPLPALVGVDAAHLLQAVHHRRGEHAGKRHPALLVEFAQVGGRQLLGAVADREVRPLARRTIRIEAHTANAQPGGGIDRRTVGVKAQTGGNVLEARAVRLPDRRVVHMALHMQRGPVRRAQPVAVRRMKIAVVALRLGHRHNAGIVFFRRHSALSRLLDRR